MNVKIPIRPINISTININFPIVVSSDVIPVDNPVVPNAEHTSKTRFNNGNGSVIHKINIATAHSNAPINVTTNDFIISSSCNCLPNTRTFLLPFAKLYNTRILTANVVVRMPLLQTYFLPCNHPNKRTKCHNAKSA